jgi:Molecular chaperone GrpE (heat shock protein)
MPERHKKSIPDSEESSSLSNELMPDDAVLPMPIETVAEETAGGPPEESTGEQEKTRPEEETALLTQALEEQKRQTAEYLDRAIRAQAELDNVRKRAARDIENAHKYALEQFITALLPVVDSIEMGLSASAVDAATTTSLKQGMELTLRMFTAALEKSGVKVINPQGEKFNPAYHEAVSMQQEEGIDAGRIISVMQKGYVLNGRLVRPAMVVVAK